MYCKQASSYRTRVDCEFCSLMKSMVLVFLSAGVVMAFQLLHLYLCDPSSGGSLQGGGKRSLYVGGKQTILACMCLY